MTAARLRRPAATLALLVLSAAPAVSAYAAAPTSASAVRTANQPSDPLVWGKMLYQEGCASCHGLTGQGLNGVPSVVAKGAAGVDFEVSTGRMPLATITDQALRRPHSLYTEDQTAAMAAYVASLGQGSEPAIPTVAQVDWKRADLAMGGELFRTNCAQCHSFAGQGGALTLGKQAPNLMQATPTQIYEAMLIGPNNMPQFSDATLPPAQKQAVIRYIEFLKQPDNPGGLNLGRLGPVSEGLFGWVAGFGLLVVIAVWIGVKAK